MTDTTAPGTPPSRSGGRRPGCSPSRSGGAAGRRFFDVYNDPRPKDPDKITANRGAPPANATHLTKINLEYLDVARALSTKKRHAKRASAHAGHDPPQSVPVSSPFWVPSEHVVPGTWPERGLWRSSGLDTLKFLQSGARTAWHIGAMLCPSRSAVLPSLLLPVAPRGLVTLTDLDPRPKDLRPQTQDRRPEDQTLDP